MERLMALVFVVIGIVNFVQKQNKKQNQNKGKGGIKKPQVMQRQSPLQQWMSNPYQPKMTEREAKSDVFPPIIEDETEGIEAEDRSRVGSLDYIEDIQSSEGVDYGLTRPEQMKSKEKKAAPNISVMEGKEEPVFDLSEDNLLRSIVMAEVLGPPRAIKRRIR